MRLILKRFIIVLNMWRILPVYLIIGTLKKKHRELIIDEMYHWKKCANESDNGIILFGKLLVSYKEYRNLLCYRIKSGNTIMCIIKSEITKFLFPNMETLYIKCPTIGERLYIQHGFATWISAKSIGTDCWINQQVTVGYAFEADPPTIGNGVRISAGAKVLGPIIICDNAIIAANAAVVKDVAENMIVGGVPANIIGENKEHKLYMP